MNLWLLINAVIPYPGISSNFFINLESILSFFSFTDSIIEEATGWFEYSSAEATKLNKSFSLS